MLKEIDYKKIDKNVKYKQVLYYGFNHNLLYEKLYDENDNLKTIITYYDNIKVKTVTHYNSLNKVGSRFIYSKQGVLLKETIGDLR